MTLSIDLKEVSRQHTLSIRTRISMEELPKIIGESYGKIVKYLQELGEKTEHCPFTAYYNLDVQDLDVEMGFPVRKAFPGKERILAGEIPAGQAVACIHKGPYAEMMPVYEEVMSWIAEHGYEPTGVYYEYYYNSPADVPESELLTRIEIPVKSS